MPGRRPSELRELSVRAAMSRFLLSCVVSLVVISAACLVVLQNLDMAHAIRNARTETELLAHSVVEPVVSDALVEGDPQAIEAVGSVVRKRVLRGSAVRVKIWTRGGRVVYSDEPRLVGSVFPLDAEGVAAFRTGAVAAEVTDLSRADNRFERGHGKLLAVYLPISTPSGRPLLFESYLRYQTVAQRGHELLHVVGPTLFGGLLLAGLVQLPFAFSMARRLESSHRSRKELLARASRLAAIVQTTDDAIISTDLDARVTSWNAAAERIYGYAANEVRGAPIEMLAPPEKAGEPTELLRRILAGDPVRDHQTERVRKDGSRIGVAMTSSLILGPDGEPVGLSMVVRDVTAHLRVQAERDQLLRESTAMAELLQQALLPDRLPRLTGLRLAARFLPCAGGACVGGDWYDAIPLGGNQVGLVVGDVQGHDIRSASLMGQARNALRAWASDGLAPGEVLHRLNRLVSAFAGGQLISCVYATLDVATAELVWSNAGHCPPIAVQASGAVTTLQGESRPPLGGVPDMAYTEGRLLLEPGTTLLLYTDGLVERRAESLDIGLDRLAILAGAYANTSVAGDAAEALCDALVASLLPGASQVDDVALLVAVINPPCPS